MPLDAAVHIGLSDAPYTILDSSVAAHLSNCTTQPGPLRDYIFFEGQCQSGVSGRYVYVYRQDALQMNMHEIEIYGNSTGEVGKWFRFLIKRSHSAPMGLLPDT